MSEPTMPCWARIKGYEHIKMIALRIVTERFKPYIGRPSVEVKRVHLVAHRDWLPVDMRERRAADGLDDEVMYTAQYLSNVEFTDEEWDGIPDDVLSVIRAQGVW